MRKPIKDAQKRKDQNPGISNIFKRHRGQEKLTAEIFNKAITGKHRQSSSSKAKAKEKDLVNYMGLIV